MVQYLHTTYLILNLKSAFITMNSNTFNRDIWKSFARVRLIETNSTQKSFVTFFPNIRYV